MYHIKLVYVTTWFDCNLVLTSTRRFFKDKKINEAHQVSAIWSPWKNKKLIYTKLHLKSCYYLLIVYMKKSISESRETKFWQRARYLQFAPVLQIDTRVTWKMHLFKLIPARNFFSRILLQCISNFDLNWRETLICWPSFRAFDFN